ncbi:isoprenoid biosynthesis enzyme family protein [Cesiribacter andamanensis]|uniref:Ion channel n=1 Tax=Cesiribacter andamanensis AMV16 TaxID=1279009 RepID=M7NIG9_9BACT|nr:hypothetical protein [Cesiribacter andamanensis]EMR01585.1 hypothetical protein ADICEAN_03290 [Cesiribacter andamanensis AMV16]
MNIWIFTAGLILLLLVLTDLIITTFAPVGSGKLAGYLRRGVWQLFLKLSGNKGSRKILNYAGPVSVVIWLFGWLLLIWLSNSLIFISDPGSVVESGTLRSTTWVEKTYFTGYVLSTMGSGEFIARGPGWQLYSAFISFSGYIVITIIITYLYSVVTNDITRRKVSIRIYHSGGSPQEILLRYWDGNDFSRLKNDLASLSEEIVEVAQNHMAYPILHNFHSTNREESLELNLASLDEALSILMLYKPEGVAPSLPELYELRSAITYYLQTLHNVLITPAEHVPPPPDLTPLLANELPLDGKPFEQLQSDKLKLRRKLLKSLLYNQGWKWEKLNETTKPDQIDDWLSRIRRKRSYRWPAPEQD